MTYSKNKLDVNPMVGLFVPVDTGEQYLYWIDNFISNIDFGSAIITDGPQVGTFGLKAPMISKRESYHTNNLILIYPPNADIDYVSNVSALHKIYLCWGFEYLYLAIKFKKYECYNMVCGNMEQNEKLYCDTKVFSVDNVAKKYFGPNEVDKDYITLDPFDYIGWNKLIKDIINGL